MVIELILALVGLSLSIFLFFRHPRLKNKTNANFTYKVSAIIPARNEESNIYNLITDLNKQTYQPFEIIVVDDMSKDRTSEEVKKTNAILIQIKEKPEKWNGKTWACHIGSKNANGDILLFIDADVRLSPVAIERLIYTYSQNNETISVLPYHKMEKQYEQLSAYFNLVSVAANGVTPLIKAKEIGLFGPIIFINKSVYESINGHESVKGAIVDDLSLGINLRKNNIPFHLYLGSKDDISYRMYKDGYKSLWQGWVKNFASGASSTQLYLVLLLVVWSGTGLGSLISFINATISQQWLFSSAFAAIYLAYGLITFIEARRIGNFNFLLAIFNPLYAINFFVIFFVSLFKKIFKRKVVWKDRKVEDYK